MPRSVAIDEDRVRGQGRRRAAAKPERGIVARLLLRSPKDLIAGAVAAVAIVGILVNALLLQAGRHPSPIFETASVVSPPTRVTVNAPMPAETVNPLPRPRPAQAETRPADLPKADDPVGALVRTTSLGSASAPAARVETGVNASQRVAAVQRALTDYGYGQLKPTGTIGADTQAAIQRFERERKLPITGQISDRLVRELGLATGKSIP